MFHCKIVLPEVPMEGDDGRNAFLPEEVELKLAHLHPGISSGSARTTEYLLTHMQDSLHRGYIIFGLEARLLSGKVVPAFMGTSVYPLLPAMEHLSLSLSRNSESGRPGIPHP